MRYVVYGPGAIGGAIGGRLFQHGREVLLIARGAHHDALRDRGLELQSPEGDVVLPVPVAASPAQADLRPDDVVVLAMKSQDTAAALRALAEAGADLPVVCAQNGVENERAAARRFSRVYGMCVFLPGVHLEPGVVQIHAAAPAGILDVGCFPHGVDALAERVAADIDGSGFLSRADPDVMAQKQAKLLMNLGNALEAAVGPTGRGGELYRRARDEALACFAAAGIEVASGDDPRRSEIRRGTVSGGERPGGSSWQSLARGLGSIETDYLNGEIVLLGRIHGIPTPVNALLQRVANQLAHDQVPPGTLTPEDLLAQLG